MRKNKKWVISIRACSVMECARGGKTALQFFLVVGAYCLSCFSMFFLGQYGEQKCFCEKTPKLTGIKNKSICKYSKTMDKNP